MTIKEIIKLCSRMANLDVSEDCFETDVLDEKAKTLVQCCNFALQKLYETATALKQNTVTAKNGFIDLSQLGFDRVISLTRFGKNAPFRYGAEGLHVREDGDYLLVYAEKAPSAEWSDEAVFPSPRISVRIFAYEVIAEYFFTLADFSAAKAWENRFENALQAVSLKTSSMTLPAGRWV